MEGFGVKGDYKAMKNPEKIMESIGVKDEFGLFILIALFFGFLLGLMTHNRIYKALDKRKGQSVVSSPADSHEKKAGFFKAQWQSCVDSIDEQTMCVKGDK